MVNYDFTTLVVRHLPHEFSKDDKISLLKYLGAVDVHCFGSNHKKSSFVFAKFKSKEDAQNVLKTLHQKEVLGQLVCVEYSRNRPGGHEDEEDFKMQDDEKTQQRKMAENFLHRINSWSNHLDLNHPPPSHLKYSYPPPDTTVVRNIGKALFKVPKFYTQVLHLMNRMNLPCPFTDDYVIKDDNLDEALEDESELESEPEIKSKIESKKRIRKYKLPKVEKRARVVPNPIKPEEVFETKDIVTKKIELNIPTNLTVVNESQDISEGFQLMEKIEKPKEIVHENEPQIEDQGIITEEELSLNRIPAKDLHVLPVFKNYQSGMPSCRLYLKNLAKLVQIEDLNYIFKRYLIDTEEQGTMFDIRLMQEGRMKGQAFVTLQNTEIAEKALQETNGYILKGKAMVVQFARSSKPK